MDLGYLFIALVHLLYYLHLFNVLVLKFEIGLL